MRMLRVGARALLVEVDGAREAQALYARARRQECPATDIVPGATTVLFDGLPGESAVEALADQVTGWPTGDDEPAEQPAEPVELPTHYDGPDLDEVAAQWGMSPAEVVRTHTDLEYTVAFCGFAPGFAYCTGLPERLAVRRRATPRPRVPAGSVGLAGGFTGVYPGESPGGWQLIGRTDVAVWDLDRDPPALLAPGTRVRFRPADA